MKTLIVPFFGHVNRYTAMRVARDSLESLVPIPLKEVPWPEFPYLPDVRFRIAYTADSLLLAYTVHEQHVKAEYRESNDPVYRDSCVEFFLSLDGLTYYNMEFNCLGTALIGHGDADKAQRRFLPAEKVAQVRTAGCLQADSGSGFGIAWELLLNIPFTVFDAHAIDSLVGRRCQGNFFKCGDDLPIPHFVSWNRIHHGTPNFHLPQYFGELVFS